MKKFLAAVLAFALVLCLGITALADNGSGTQPDPAPYVPVVTPKPTATPKAEETVAEDLEEAAPAVSEVTAEEAVAAVSAETPVIVVASSDGFATTGDEAIPVEAVQLTTVAAAKEELSTEDYEQLVADINEIAEKDGGAVVSAFWFSIDESKSDVKLDKNNGLTFTFACVGKDAPHVYLNGKLLDVVQNEDGTWTVILPEAGSVVITTTPED